MDIMKMFVRSQLVNVEIVKWDLMENRVIRVIKEPYFKVISLICQGSKINQFTVDGLVLPH